MKTQLKLRLQLLMQNSFFVILFLILIGLIGWITHQYHVATDVTQSSRNILSEGSVNVLKQMKSPITITVFASADNASHGETYRKGVKDFIYRYQRTKPDIKVEFVSPAEDPKRTQEAGVVAEGELIVEYEKRSEHLLPPYAEQEMTNLLVRLSRTRQQAIMYLDGHGERNLIGKKDHDIGEFGKQLEDKGFKFANPDLVSGKNIPEQSSMLVIAGPQKDLSDIEVKKIKAWLDSGGNLLWMLDDDNYRGMKVIAEYLGLKVSSGVAVDPSSSKDGVSAKHVFSYQYGDHAITRNFMLRTLFQEAHQVTAQGNDDNGWQVSNLIDVAASGWLENDRKELSGDVNKISYDAKSDVSGPINIAVALERKYGKKGQRVVVIGNANFLSNTFVATQGNLDLGVNIVNWLAGDDSLITIQPKPLKDANVNIKPGILTWLIFLPIFGKPLGLFMLVIPLALLVSGILLWLKRRKA